jgi:hypothetical protein
MEKFKKIEALHLCKNILEGLPKDVTIHSAIQVKKLLQNNRWDTFDLNNTDQEINYIYSIVLAREVIDYLI